MAGCLSFVERGNISPENVKRWTQRLSNVLASSTARQRFRIFLESRELEDEQKLLKFWEECDQFLVMAKGCYRRDNLEVEPQSSESGADDKGNHNTEIILKEAKKIVKFAEDEINFDAEMETLHSAVKSGNIEEIVTTISEAKQTAAQKLEWEGYPEFRKYLLKKSGLLKDKK